MHKLRNGSLPAMIPPLVHHRDVPHQFRYLLPEGTHFCSISEIERAFVSDTRAGQAERRKLFKGFIEFRAALTSCEISGEQWIDGSFTSRKDFPRDIDVITFVQPDYESIVPANRTDLARRLFDAGQTLADYSTHNWLIPCFDPDSANFAQTSLTAKKIVDTYQRTRNFRGRLREEREGIKKGILRLPLGLENRIPNVDAWLKL